MSTVALLLIALGLSMDAFAVAITSGVFMKRLRLSRALRIALFFGGFQALMPIIGWLAGIGLRGFISTVDHWIAFGLLGVIGGKMVYESRRLETDPCCVESDGKLDCSESWLVLLSLSIATSIDALVVGLSFSFLKVAIPFPAAVIGVVTFLISLLGVFLGTRIGHFFEKKIETLGGLILIGIGLKILFDHLTQ